MTQITVFACNGCGLHTDDGRGWISNVKTSSMDPCVDYCPSCKKKVTEQSRGDYCFYERGQGIFMKAWK